MSSRRGAEFICDVCDKVVFVSDEGWPSIDMPNGWNHLIFKDVPYDLCPGCWKSLERNFSDFIRCGGRKECPEQNSED